MNNIVNIHGKPYMTVAGRVEEAHKEAKLTIVSELVSANPIIFKATVTTEKGQFVAHSAAYQNGMIEKQSPYEVAETSAIGRALGFAGFGIVEGIATADEVVKAQATPVKEEKGQDTMDEIDKALNETYENDPIIVKTAGPASKNPGRKYKYNTVTKQFVSWVNEVTS